MNDLRLIAASAAVVEHTRVWQTLTTINCRLLGEWLSRKVKKEYSNAFGERYLEWPNDLMNQATLAAVSVELFCDALRSNGWHDSLVREVVESAQEMVRDIVLPSNKKGTALAFFFDNEGNSLNFDVSGKPANTLKHWIALKSGRCKDFLAGLGYSANKCHTAGMAVLTTCALFLDWCKEGGSLYTVWATLVGLNAAGAIDEIGLPSPPNGFVPVKHKKFDDDARVSYAGTADTPTTMSTDLNEIALTDRMVKNSQAASFPRGQTAAVWEHLYEQTKIPDIKGNHPSPDEMFDVMIRNRVSVELACWTIFQVNPEFSARLREAAENNEPEFPGNFMERLSAHKAFQSQERLNWLVYGLYEMNSVESFFGELGYGVDQVRVGLKTANGDRHLFSRWCQAGHTLYELWKVLYKLGYIALLEKLGYPLPPERFKAKFVLKFGQEFLTSVNRAPAAETSMKLDEPAANPFAKVAAKEKPKTLSDLEDSVFFKAALCAMTIYETWYAWLCCNLEMGTELELSVAEIADRRNADPLLNSAEDVFKGLVKSERFCDWTEQQFVDSIAEISEPHLAAVVNAWRDYLKKSGANGGVDAELRRKVKEFLVDARVFSGAQSSVKLITAVNKIIREFELTEVDHLTHLTESDFADLGCFTKPQARIVHAAACKLKN